MRTRWCWVLWLLWALFPRGAAYAQAPATKDVDAIHLRLVQARAKLLRPDFGLTPAEQDILLMKLAKAETALQNYERLSQRGRVRHAATAPLYVAGSGLVADDLTGVGTADDVLLPLIALGVLATSLLTQRPALPGELDIAWRDTLAALDAVSQAATLMSANKAKPQEQPGTVELTAGGRKKIGNLVDLKDKPAREAVRLRGGGQSQVQQIAGTHQDKAVGELANLAAQGDAQAETAIKIIKQASRKAEKYGGKP